MSDYKLTLQSHNSDLQELINMANELPDKVEGIQLNFEVIGGLEHPTNPTENMIWVNTDIPISTWIFSPTEPKEPIPNMIWFYTGVSSNLEFNALKDNAIQINLLYAKQYISDTWVTKKVKINRSGIMTDLYIYIYKNGDEYIDTTGGWTARNAASKSSNSLDFGVSGYVRGGDFFTNNKIDLSSISFIVFKFSGSMVVSTGGTNLKVWASKSQLSSSEIDLSGGDATYTHDISGNVNEITLNVENLDGEYFIGAHAGLGGGAGETINNLSLLEVRLMGG